MFNFKRIIFTINILTSLFSYKSYAILDSEEHLRYEMDGKRMIASVNAQHKPITPAILNEIEDDDCIDVKKVLFLNEEQIGNAENKKNDIVYFLSSKTRQIEYISFIQCNGLQSFIQPDIGHFDHLTTFTLINCHSLKTLHLVAPRLEIFEIRSCPQLEHVSLGGNKSSLKEVNVIGTAIETIDLPKNRMGATLSKLNLSGNLKLGDNALDALLEKFPFIKTLDVSNSGITNPEIRAQDPYFPVGDLNQTSEEFKRNLRMVGLLEKDFSEEKVFKGEIDFRGCKMNVSELRVLGSALKRVNFPLSLLLSHNNIDQQGTTKLIVELRAIEHLTSLDISHNPFSDIGARNLEGFLSNNTTIKTLILEKTGISDAGAECLAKGLQQNNSLETLNLRENLISQVGLESFGTLFTKNQSLKTLNFSRNKVNNDALRRLELIIKGCKRKEFPSRNLPCIMLDHNKLTPEGVIEFIKNIKKESHPFIIDIKNDSYLSNKIKRAGIKERYIQY